MSKRIIVIGSGIAGLSAACCLAQSGAEVTVLEKNSTPGGRARQFDADGFRFDMGPSWYWMPDVFEHFFARFGKKPSDYYELKRLDPSYQVFFGKNEVMPLPADAKGILSLFDRYEPGSSQKLIRFLSDAEYKYRTGMQEFVFKPSHSAVEYLDWKILKAGLRMKLLQSLSSEIRSLFRDPRLVQILEFPVLFLGATPDQTPAMYSMMNYADMVLGTWYPMGGMGKIIDGMVSLAKELGVRFEFDAAVTHIHTEGKKVRSVLASNGKRYSAGAVVGGADYHHVEQLLEKTDRQYNEAYWKNRVMAPSSLLFYLGIEGRMEGVEHHNLFFDADFEKHSMEIYRDPQWPSDPLFYMCVPSVTDPSVAPAGCENVFLLIPIAPGLPDTPEIREKYLHLLLQRIQDLTGQSLAGRIRYQRSYCINDFITDYHSYRGNAYGLANTLKQTAFLKPKMKSRKVDNLFFTGQLTVPGPGMPPALISGQIVAREVMKHYA